MTRENLPFPAVCVRWVDSANFMGWVDIHDKRKLCEIVTVGFLVRETKKRIVIASCIDEENDMMAGATTIPRCSITSLLHFPAEDD